MLEIIGVMLVGMVMGYLFRNQKMTYLSKVILVAICVLLLSLGIVVGNNKMILSSLDTIGWQSLLLCIGSVLGSVVFAGIVYHFFFKNK